MQNFTTSADQHSTQSISVSPFSDISVFFDINRNNTPNRKGITIRINSNEIEGIDQLIKDAIALNSTASSNGMITPFIVFDFSNTNPSPELLNAIDATFKPDQLISVFFTGISQEKLPENMSKKYSIINALAVPNSLNTLFFDNY